MKKCSKCREVKPDSGFYHNRRNTDGLGSWCKKCNLGYKNRRYATDANFRETVAERNRQNYNPVKRREYGLQRRFGITAEEYDRMLEVQSGCCAACGRHQTEFKSRLAVDHNHETGEVRGLLCTNCNTIWGLSGENADILLKIIDYGRRYQ